MRIEEFKAWLDGFGESIKGSPTKAQWAKIQEKLATVNELYPYYSPYYYQWTFTSTDLPATITTTTNNTPICYYAAGQQDASLLT